RKKSEYPKPEMASKGLPGVIRYSGFVILSDFDIRHSSFPRLLPEQVCDSDLERRQQLFGEHFLSGENPLQHQTVLAAVIHLHVVVARIDHPEARDIQLL